MDSREFVRMVKHEAVDSAVRIVLTKLESPRSPQPIPESADVIQRGISNFYNAGALVEQRQSAWFSHLPDEQKKMLAEIVSETAELSALSFCTLIDGVSGPYEGVFEIVAVSNGRRKTLNPENTDMLHDLLSDVCAEDREG
jgi:hypothetical protein